MSDIKAAAIVAVFAVLVCPLCCLSAYETAGNGIYDESGSPKTDSTAEPGHGIANEVGPNPPPVKPPLNVFMEIAPIPLISNYNGTVIVVVTTSDGSPVQDARIRLWASESVWFEAINGTTNVDGIMSTEIYVPWVDNPKTCMFVSWAEKDEYQNGSASINVIIQHETRLSFYRDIYTVPDSPRAAQPAIFIVNLRDKSGPLEGAYVSLTVWGLGINPSNGYTDAGGDFTSCFVSPDVTSPQTFTVTVSISKDGYYGEWSQKDITVVPWTTEPVDIYSVFEDDSIHSNGSSNLSVCVRFDHEPVYGAEVSLYSADGGRFTPEAGYTGEDGFFLSEFFAPVVQKSMRCDIWVVADRTGYGRGITNVSIVIDPVKQPVLRTDVFANPGMLRCGENSSVSVSVTDGTAPVGLAKLRINCTWQGTSFFNSTPLADETGKYLFIFIAPNITTDAIFIIAISAEKPGYVTSNAWVNITVEAKMLQETKPPGSCNIIAVSINIMIAGFIGCSAAAFFIYAGKKETHSMEYIEKPSHRKPIMTPASGFHRGPLIIPIAHASDADNPYIPDPDWDGGYF
jgi:hypothetical protein